MEATLVPSVGFGLCISINAAPLLIVSFQMSRLTASSPTKTLTEHGQTELAYPTQRGPITAMYNTNWYVGSIIAAVSLSHSASSSLDLTLLDILWGAVDDVRDFPYGGKFLELEDS